MIHITVYQYDSNEGYVILSYDLDFEDWDNSPIIGLAEGFFCRRQSNPEDQVLDWKRIFSISE